MSRVGTSATIFSSALKNVVSATRDPSCSMGARSVHRNPHESHTHGFLHSQNSLCRGWVRPQLFFRRHSKMSCPQLATHRARWVPAPFIVTHTKAIPMAFSTHKTVCVEGGLRSHYLGLMSPTLYRLSYPDIEST